MHGNLYTPEMISACNLTVSQKEINKEIVSSIPKKSGNIQLS